MLIFTAAIVAVIGFVLTNGYLANKHPILFYLIFGFLGAGNIFFTCFAHDRLTIQRNKRRAIEKYLGLEGLEISNFKVVDENNRSLTKRQKWIKGFWSHLFPFFLADIALAFCGIWLVANLN